MCIRDSIDTRPDWRGGQNQVLLTLRGLRARGHNVELLALGGDSGLNHAFRDEARYRDDALRGMIACESYAAALERIRDAPLCYKRRAAMRAREPGNGQAVGIVRVNDVETARTHDFSQESRAAGTNGSRRNGCLLYTSRCV